jgi:murein DD-endopeptidase MepM/ murein hydrolase activator NlpD
VSGNYAFHAGTDIAAGCWANIYAAGSGRVTYAGWNGGYGNFVLIEHGNGIASAYGHIVSGGILVRQGQWVSAGAHVAEVGTTGSSTGCHLHFEIRQNGVAINPVKFMAARGVRIG